MFGLVLLGRFNDPPEFFRSLPPSEGLTGIIVVGKELQQKVLELLLGAMNTLRQTSLAQDAEEAFHHIHPRGVGGGMVKVHARVMLQPSFRRIILVNVQVVQDDVKVAARKSGGHVVHKAQEVYRGPALLDMRQDLAGGNLQRGQQGLRAMTDVLVGPTPRFLGAEGEQGLGAVQRLDSRFSSTHKTKAFSGGCRYRPTISSSLASKSGSGLKVNVRMRCGCSPQAARISWTVVLGKCRSCASVRTLQRL